MRVYVAGPYSKGDTILNVRKAIEAAERLAAAGHTPYIPHLTMLWHLLRPHGDLFWRGYDLEWLRCCDAVLRLPGESVGADGEVHMAKVCGIPVYESVAELPMNVAPR